MDCTDVSDSQPRALWRGDRTQRERRKSDPRHECRARRARSQRARRVARDRLACKKLNAYSLSGYTLYTTCECCPMCMACALWASLDRVVYGATIADAARFGHQIHIPAAEIVKRPTWMRRRWAGRARSLPFALHKSDNAGYVQEMEFPKALMARCPARGRKKSSQRSETVCRQKRAH